MELRFKCWCGSDLQTYINGQKFCLIHNDDYMKPPDPVFKEPKQKIPRYSGKSKTPYGGYEER